MILFKWLSAAIGVMYIVLGIFVILKLWFIFPLEPLIAYALGILLILYGVFRIGRVFYNAKKNENNEA